MVSAYNVMTLTDAVNAFIQQSINAEGMPLIVTQNSKDAIKEQAIAILTGELKKGEASVKSGNDWISEEEFLPDSVLKHENNKHSASS